MAHKFILLVNGDNQDDKEFDSYDDAYSCYEEWLEGMQAGYDVMNLMGDVDDSEKIDPHSVKYEIVEYDESGKEVDRTYL